MKVYLTIKNQKKYARHCEKKIHDRRQAIPYIQPFFNHKGREVKRKEHRLYAGSRIGRLIANALHKDRSSLSHRDNWLIA